MRLGTEDFDNRARRPRRAQDGSAGRDNAAQPLPSIIPLPAAVEDGIRAVIETITAWYVQDVDDEADGTAAKTDFKKSAIDLVIDGLFRGEGMDKVADGISEELSESFLHLFTQWTLLIKVAEEGDIVVSPITISRLITMLEDRVTAMLTAGIDDFAKEGKGKVEARKSAWYLTYKDTLTAMSKPHRARLSMADASAVVSLLAEHWNSTTLPKLLSEFLSRQAHSHS